jgi:lysophospholipase L1-like esterase
LSDAKKYPEFYIAKNSFDGKHLNNKGAKIFTKLLAEKFIELNKAD